MESQSPDTVAGLGGLAAEIGESRQGPRDDGASTSRSMGPKRTSGRKLTLVTQPASSESSAHIGELLGISNPNISQSVMISIIEDPLQCGYLLNFCELEHSTENLCFVMEVVRYRENFSSDREAWPRSWQHIDEAEGLGSTSKTHRALSLHASRSETALECGLPFTENMGSRNVPSEDVGALSDFCFQGSDRPWPSRIIKQETVESLVRNIWNTYLADHAPSQIFMPSIVMSKTKLRMQALSVYGPEVFGECLLDPLKTLQRDILPRFLCSNVYNTMKARLNSLIHLPPAALLIVPPPEITLLTSKDLDYFSEKRMFTLDEILHDRYLHNEFHAHLKKSVQTENLLCVRMVEVNMLLCDFFRCVSMIYIAMQIFEEMVRNGDKEADAQAWTVFRFFVTPGSAYEVSLYSRHKKELMIQLASPQGSMFEELKKSALSMLSVNFNSYRFADDYRNLYRIMREVTETLVWLCQQPVIFMLPCRKRKN
jgi:hypothetical protein